VCLVWQGFGTNELSDDDNDEEEYAPDETIRAKWMLDGCGSFEEVMLYERVIFTMK
jgi:hypothetical protein